MKKNQAGFAPVIIVLVVLIGFVGFYYLRDLGPRAVITDPSSSPIATVEGSSKPTADPTANWKTFTNTEYNYVVKYPSNFVIGEDGMAGENIQKTTALIIYQDTSNNYNSPRFSVAIRLDNLSFKDIVTQHYNKLSKYQATQSEMEMASKNLGFSITDPVIQEPIKQTTMFGFPAYTYTVKGNVVDNGVSEGIVESEIHKYIWLERNSKFYLVSYTDITPINQILSTFKFTN